MRGRRGRTSPRTGWCPGRRRRRTYRGRSSGFVSFVHGGDLAPRFGGDEVLQAGHHLAHLAADRAGLRVGRELPLRGAVEGRRAVVPAAQERGVVVGGAPLV